MSHLGNCSKHNIPYEITQEERGKTGYRCPECDKEHMAPMREMFEKYDTKPSGPTRRSSDFWDEYESLTKKLEAIRERQ